MKLRVRLRTMLSRETEIRSQQEKKKQEERALIAAQNAGLVLPSGRIIHLEEPDFRIESEEGILGIELTELLPLPRNDSFSSPMAEQDQHRKTVSIAEAEYYRLCGSFPVQVTVYFWNVKRGACVEKRMAHELVDFVRSHLPGNRTLTFGRLHLPEGFGTVNIAPGRKPWQSWESVGQRVSDTHKQIAARVAQKNERLPKYRTNLPNSPIWLLLHSCLDVSRGVWMPSDISDYGLDFDFDRVFFYSSLSGSVKEISRAACAKRIG